MSEKIRVPEIVAAEAPVEERRFREEVRLKDRELDLKEKELQHQIEAAKRSSGFHFSPTTTALVAGSLTVLTSVITAGLSAKATRDAEERRTVREMQLKEKEQQFQIILRATEDQSPEQAAQNLLFFVDLGYLPDSAGMIQKRASSGNVPVITSPGGTVNPIEERVRGSSGGAPAGTTPPPTGPVSSLIVRDHVLYRPDGAPVSVVATPALSRLAEPRLLIVHATYGGTLEGATRFLSSAQARASAHVIIGRDGTVVQMVPFDYASWHAGRSEWKGLTGLNKYSLGVNLVGWGPLTRRGEQWVSSTGARVPADEVVESTDPETGVVTAWHRYTEAQLRSAMAVGKAVVEAYPAIQAVVGHSEVSRTKTDPGPAFPMERLRSEIFAQRR